MASVQVEQAPSTALQSLIRDCLAGSEICRQAEGHCLEQGGRYAEPEHLRLLADCSRLFRLSAELLAADPRFHPEDCGLCAKVGAARAKACAACAESCARFEDDGLLRDCAAICRAGGMGFFQ